MGACAQPRGRRWRTRTLRAHPPGGIVTTRSEACDRRDSHGHLRHDGGVVSESPGLYAVGLPLLRRRKSTFIHGAEDDARDLIEHLAGYLGAEHEHDSRSHRGTEDTED